jgi:hypothetical protein
MGNGRWSTDVYSSRATTKKATGQSTFAYNDDVLAKLPSHERKIHDRLEPKSIKWRESRDSAEHPESNSIAVAFDVTGSMGTIPRVLQSKLPALHGLLQRKGYIEHPQVLFAAIGDSYTDMAPLQVGQFESDNRMDEDLEHIWLEGNGGGQMHEGYEMFLYFLARKTACDGFEKRGKKGYAFIIGDEKTYPAATREHIKEIFGEASEADIPVQQLVKEVQEKYELFFLMPRSASYFTTHPEILASWKQLLGERALVLDDEAAVCETIALAIGLHEGTIDIAKGVQDLLDLGVEEKYAKVAGAALAGVKVEELDLALGGSKAKAIVAPAKKATPAIAAGSKRI